MVSSEPRATDVEMIINTTLMDEQITTIIEIDKAHIGKALGSRSTLNKLIKLGTLIMAKAIRTFEPQSQFIVDYGDSQGNSTGL